MLSYLRGVSVIVLLSLVPCLAYAAPKIFYTDIMTGPNSGGENDKGAYLTVFGAGFGVAQGDSQITINNVPVATYKYWSDTKITVQPGSEVTSGVVKITVGSESFSSPAITFTVTRGEIYFVALNGSDSSGQAGNINRPFRSAQKTLDRSSFGPGDHLVLRGGDWTDNNRLYHAFLSIHHKSGTAANPMVIMGYPTDTVNILRTPTNGITRGLHSWATNGHFVLANFHVNMNGGGGSCVNLTPGSENIRVVNIEGQGMWEDSGGSACIEGSGKRYRILGNHVHHNGGSKLYHALYFDGRDTTGPNDIEIAYNHIHHQTGGRGIQIYGDTGTLINNVRVHHNVIHHIPLDGILFGRDSGTGFQAYNNIIYRTADGSLRGTTSDIGISGGCIRLDSPAVVAEIYNNTFMDCAVDNDPYSGAVRFQRASKATLMNNVVTGKYFSKMGSFPDTLLSSNNLWSGAGAPPSWDTNAVSADPQFVNITTGIFRLQASSPAIDRGSASVSAVVTTDYEGNVRPQGRGYDIGAFEASGSGIASPTKAQPKKK